MELDPLAAAEEANEKMEKSKSILNAWVAVTIALLAVFMGICKVKDDNVCQSMQAAQTDRLDNWDYYQNKNTQEKLLVSEASVLHYTSLMLPADKKAEAQKEEASMKKKASEIHKERDDIKKKAEDAQTKYDALNFHDDQFDLSDTLLAMSIALLAVTSLTQKKWLYWVALVPTFFGIYLVICGLFLLTGPGTHPDFLIKYLSPP